MTVNAAGIGKDAGQRTTIAKVRLFALITSAKRIKHEAPIFLALHTWIYLIGSSEKQTDFCLVYN